MKLHYLYLKENESMVMIFIPFGQYSVSLIIGTTSVIRKVKSLLNSRGDSSEFLKPGILNIWRSGDDLVPIRNSEHGTVFVYDEK